MLKKNEKLRFLFSFMSKVKTYSDCNLYKVSILQRRQTIKYYFLNFAVSSYTTGGSGPKSTSSSLSSGH